MMAGDMVHVPYKGAGPALVDLLGQMQVMFDTTPGSIAHAAGQLRAGGDDDIARGRAAGPADRW